MKFWKKMILNILSGVTAAKFSVLNLSIFSTAINSVTVIKSSILTTHIFYSGVSLSNCTSQSVKINFGLNFQFILQFYSDVFP